MTEPTTNGAGADIEQIVHALERARDRLQAHADDLRNQRDYSSEFASEDAQRMREAIEALRGLQAQRKAPPVPEGDGDDDAERDGHALPDPTFHVRWHSAYRGYTLCAKAELGGIDLFTGDQMRSHAADRVASAMTRVVQDGDWMVPFMPVTGFVVKHAQLGELYDRFGVHSYAMGYAQAVVASLLGATPALLQAAPATMPMQPVIMVEGVARFRANAMVDKVLEHSQRHGFGLNELACQEFTAQERMQFAQLIGYSVSGYGELSYVSDASYYAAAHRAVAAEEACEKAATDRLPPGDDNSADGETQQEDPK